MGDVTNVLKTVFNPLAAQAGQVPKVMKSALGMLGLGAPELPNLPNTPTAPVPDSIEAKKRATIELQRKYATAGRAGTVLSQNSKLG